MLDFINNNATLFAGIIGVLTAIISAFVTLIVSRSTDKSKTISELKKDVEMAKSELKEANDNLSKYTEELKKYKDLEIAEQSIDKSHGSIYKEKLPNGNSRDICAYCWERDHKKIPIVTIYYDFGRGQSYYGGDCLVCKKFCKEDHLGYLPF